MAETPGTSGSDEGLFKGLCFALCGFTFEEDRMLKGLVGEQGGTISFIVKEKTTHVVASYEEVAKTGFKVRKAKEFKIPVVSEMWITQSIAEGTLQKVEEFKPQMPLQEYVPGEVLDYIVYKSHLEEYLEETNELSRSVKDLFADLLDLEPNLNDYYDPDVEIPELVYPFINPPADSVDGLAVIKQILRSEGATVGYLRLRLGELLVWFLELKFIPLDKALRKSGIFGDLLDLGFRFPNCTILHCLVKHVVIKILHGNSNALKSYLLLDYDIVSRLIANYDIKTAGWHGHLFHMARVIQEISQQIPFIASYLLRRPRWKRFLAVLDAVEEAQQLPLDEYPPPRPLGNMEDFNNLEDDVEEFMIDEEA